MTHCEICRTWDQCATQGCLAEAPKRKQMTSESHAEQIARVEGMASGDSTWDLSDNDCAALATVLKERAELLQAMKTALAYLDRDGIKPSEWYRLSGEHVASFRIAIGEAEGKRMRIELPIKPIGSGHEETRVGIKSDTTAKQK